MWHVGVRTWEGERPEGRRGPCGEERCAVRKVVGASLAKTRAGKLRGCAELLVESEGEGLIAIVVFWKRDWE